MNCGKRMGRMKETKKFKDNWQKYFGPALGIGAVFLIWYLVCRMEVVSAYVLPSPARVWTSFLKMVKTGELWRDISISFLRVMKGFAIAFLFAFVLGMFRALFPGSSGYYEYIVQFFRNVPPLSMIPLLILWCGIGETTKTVIIVLASFFPMYLNIVKGFTGCDSKLLEVGDYVRLFRSAANFSASCCPMRWQIFWWACASGLAIAGAPLSVRRWWRRPPDWDI